MKKRFLPIATAISAAALLAACSQTELIDDGSVKNNGTADNNAVTFSTYTAKKGGTRAGYEGNMTNATLKEKGFGVFAYYTPGTTYGEVRNNSGEYSAPNFMYNQKVYVKNGEAKFTYSPLKYWPNDFSDSDVDDKGATGSGEYGRVSFFAYAPHVANANVAQGTVEGNVQSGITGMTSNATHTDPYIFYTLGKDVDLLWGTYDNTSAADNTVINENEGVKGTDENDGSYAGDIVKDKWVAADLTKQKVGTDVAFKFVHALAGIGGTVTENGEDPTPTNKKSGFKVRLKINDNKEENREPFTVDGTDGTYNRTIVTIKNISISNTTITKPGDDNEGEDQTIGTLHKSGKLNLATGKWDFAGATDANNGDVSQKVITDATEDSETDFELNKVIAEYVTGTTKYLEYGGTTVLDYFKDGIKINEVSHTGVTEDEIDVYDGVANPLYLFPGDEPLFEITVEYVVRQYDAALANQYTEVNNKITKIVTFPKVEINTYYTLIMHLGLTGVNFTATVEKWTDYEKKEDNTNDDRTDGETADDLEEIELPSSVK